MNYFKKNRVLFILLILYFIINLFFLTSFPFVHSDEAWLSGLSRNISEQGKLSVTEPFFDLFPRHPHAVKIIFHVIQIIFLKIFTYNIFSFRLISLIAAITTLYFFYRLSLLITDNNKLALAAVTILGLDIQFIYASHFARQEIILLMILISGLYYYFSSHNFLDTKKRIFNKRKGLDNLYPDIFTGLIFGVAIGIHPNSFLITLPIIFIYLYLFIFTEKIKLKQFFSFIITLSLMAIIFITLSFSFDPHFIHNYANYGQKLGVFNSLLLKLDRLDYFYLKLFHRVSGTYYIPEIKFQFFLFIAVLIYSIVKLFSRKNKSTIFLLLTIVAINTGYVLIGRYNQTGIIFIFPFFYLLLINIINDLKNSRKYIYIFIIIILVAANTGFNLYTDTYSTYNNYLNQISRVVSSKDTVLANLNCEYYFDNAKLFDYRNLAYLDENNLTFEQYIEENNIQYIIYPQEMDFIYNRRPVWNILYGNLYPYYTDMKNFLSDNCNLIYEFTAPTYGMRIVHYIGEENWRVRIYKVK